MQTDTTSNHPCETCKHAIFDEKWGEYKCGVSYLYMYHAFTMIECEHYEKAPENNSQTRKEKKWEQ